MADEAKGRWVEIGGGDFRPVLGGMWRVEYDPAPAGAIVRYWKWEEAMPLPDKPGVRFWGKADGEEPKWWFSLMYPSGSEIGFYSQDWGYSRVGGLTRLPDPEEETE